MKIKEDISYGVIPYIEDEGMLKFFLIHQHSHWKGDTYWVFPKGHPENGETPEETARRELEEETQIKLAKLDIEHPFVISYDFTDGDTKIEKSVTFFLGEAASKDYELDGVEVTEGGWFTYEAAREKITFDNSKKILDDAVKHLER